jgi:hypothetical protein
LEQLGSSTPEEAALWIGLSLVDGLGSQTYRALLSEFGSPESVYAAPRSELRRIVSDNIAHQISAGPDSTATASALAWLEKPGNHIVTLAAYWKSPTPLRSCIARAGSNCSIAPPWQLLAAAMPHLKAKRPPKHFPKH